MNTKTLIFLIGLIGIVGSSAMIANGVFPNLPIVMIGFVILSASAALFVALLVEVMTANIVNATISKDLENQTSLLSSVIGRSIYNILKDENKKD